jgi:hypothetical protein
VQSYLNPGLGNAANWQEGITPGHVMQSGFTLSRATRKNRES